MKKTLLGGLFACSCLMMVLAMVLGTFAADTAKGKDVPGTVALDSIKEKFTAVKFDHGIHTQFATAGCGQCHHDHGTNNDRCQSCHALKPEQYKGSVVSTFTACRNCHGKFDSETPGMPSLKVAYHAQCFQCHKGMGNVGSGPKGCTEKCHDKATQ